MDSEETATFTEGQAPGGARPGAPGLLVARTGDGTAYRDHCFFTEATVIGRGQLPRCIV